MLKYCIKRVFLVIPIMVGVVTLIFLMSYLTPGDPADMILGADATAEEKEILREELGLNDPIYIRYVNYLVGIVTRFDFGQSYTTGRPIKGEILQRYPTTIRLAFSSVAVAIIISLPLGIIAAVRQYSIVDNVAMIAAMFGVSMPQFWLGLMLILAFAVKLGWLPSSGITNPMGWILPIATIGVTAAAGITRNTRSSMLEVIRQDYIRTARAKGVKNSVVYMKHALKNAFIPILNVLGGMLCHQLGGSLMAESVFSIPGLGKYMVDAISARNFPAVQGGVILIAFVASLITLLVDLLYTVVDPRVKSHFTKKSDKRKKVTTQPAKEGAVNG